jgi:hypothetical protein
METTQCEGFSSRPCIIGLDATGARAFIIRPHNLDLILVAEPSPGVKIDELVASDSAEMIVGLSIDHSKVLVWEPLLLGANGFPTRRWSTGEGARCLKLASKGFHTLVGCKITRRRRMCAALRDFDR